MDNDENGNDHSKLKIFSNLQCEIIIIDTVISFFIAICANFYCYSFFCLVVKLKVKISFLQGISKDLQCKVGY